MTFCSMATDVQIMRTSFMSKSPQGTLLMVGSPSFWVALRQIDFNFILFVKSRLDCIGLELGEHFFLLDSTSQQTQAFEVRIIGYEKAMVDFNPALLVRAFFLLILFFRQALDLMKQGLLCRGECLGRN